MNVLFTLTYYTPHWTGLTEHAKRLAEGLVTRGYTSTVVTTQHESSLPLNETINGVHVVRTPVWFRLSRTLFSPIFFLKTWQEIHSADVVIAYTPLAEIVLISLMVKLQRKRLILVHNGDLLLPRGIGNRIIEKIFDLSSHFSGILADSLIAYSLDYAHFSRFLKQFRSKTTAILPLFPLSTNTSPVTTKIKQRIPKQRHPLIGFAGRFVQEKGFDVLLRAIPEIVKEFPDALFVFAGETNMVYENFFEQNAELVEQVHKYFFSLGRLSQEEMRGFYPLLDVFVLPSRSDCLAFVQVEAMLAGVPVVATNIPGARVPVKETGMGTLVAVEDPHDLAKGIVEVLKNRSVYEKKGKLVAELFNYEKTLDRYEEIIFHV